MALLEGENVSKSFGGLMALTGVDFELRRGEILGLIGPNGAGKTTLFNLITGAYRPSSGRISFQGRDISRSKPHAICRYGISRTYQLVRPFASLTVLENVLVGIYFGRARGSGNNRRTARAEAEELLELVGLAGKVKERAEHLTLMERRRLEIARALATLPSVLLLDEVIGGLNLTEIAQTMHLIRGLRDRGITIFMIEHVMKAIMGLSDRIMVLHHGELIAQGTPVEVANDQRVITAYLGEKAEF
jgi:branched-chain amino acid transport system ATP-binding protein